MLDQLKNFNAERMDVDELVALAAFARTLRAEYEATQVDEPEWVGTQLNSLRREIQTRMTDHREAELRKVNAQLDGLKSREEKKAELEKKRDDLLKVVS